MQSTTFKLIVTSLSGNLKLKLMSHYDINFWCPRECASHPVFANLSDVPQCLEL